MMYIEPKKSEDYNCFDCVILSLSSHFKFEYKLIFANHWGFKYLPFDHGYGKTFGERIKTGWNGVPKTVLRKYHGLRLRWHKMKTSKETLDLIDYELSEKRPVAIYLDAYEIPWNTAFEKYHISHVCLAVGLEFEQNQLICIDPFSSDRLEYFAIDKDIEKIDKCCTFKLGEKRTDTYDWKLIFLDSIYKQSSMNNNNGTFKMMRIFAEDLVNHLNIEDEVMGFSEISSVPFFRKLKSIQASRANFAEVIGYIKNSYGASDLEAFEERFKNLSEEWKIIRNMLVRVFVANAKEKITKVTNKIVEVSIIEETLAIDFLKYLKEGGQCIENKNNS